MRWCLPASCRLKPALPSIDRRFAYSLPQRLPICNTLQYSGIAGCFCTRPAMSHTHPRSVPCTTELNLGADISSHLSQTVNQASLLQQSIAGRLPVHLRLYNQDLLIQAVLLCLTNAASVLHQYLSSLSPELFESANYSAAAFQQYQDIRAFLHLFISEVRSFSPSAPFTHVGLQTDEIPEAVSSYWCYPTSAEMVFLQQHLQRVVEDICSLGEEVTTYLRASYLTKLVELYLSTGHEIAQLAVQAMEYQTAVPLIPRGSIPHIPRRTATEIQTGRHLLQAQLAHFPRFRDFRSGQPVSPMEEVD